MKATIVIRDIVYPIPLSDASEKRTYEKLKIDTEGTADEIILLISKIEKIIPKSKL